MAKPDLGTKRHCQNCGTKFFDLGRDPILCPKCGTTFQVAAASAPSRGRSAAPVNDEEPEADTDAEVVSLEDADQVDDGKVAIAATDDVDIEEDDTTADDDDTFLEEEEEDDGDVADLIDGDIEDDEER